MNEWVNEWINESMNEWMNVWMYVCMCVCMYVRMQKWECEKRVTTWNRIHHVGLHDTGEHADYLRASYMTILLTDEARKAKHISRIFKLLEHFYFYILHSYTSVECGKDVKSYFACSLSYSNTFLVSAFTIFPKRINCKFKQTQVHRAKFELNAGGV